MRLRLIILFCAISFSASAQFWQKIGFKKKHDILPQLQLPKNNSISKIKNTLVLNNVQMQPVLLQQCEFSLETASATVMELAKHNMRFRIYNDASYNFSDLAHIYIKMHRLSEAKWYLLQSNNISRQENDDKHTISNLMSLAAVKIDIGDVPSAKADLLEARDLARAKGMKPETTEIEKKLVLLVQNPTPVVRQENKYAETAGSEKKTL